MKASQKQVSKKLQKQVTKSFSFKGVKEKDVITTFYDIIDNYDINPNYEVSLEMIELYKETIEHVIYISFLNFFTQQRLNLIEYNDFVILFKDKSQIITLKLIIYNEENFKRKIRLQLL